MCLRREEKIGVVSICHASPERARKFVQRMKISIVDSTTGESSKKKKSNGKEYVIDAKFQCLVGPY